MYFSVCFSSIEIPSFFITLWSPQPGDQYWYHPNHPLHKPCSCFVTLSQHWHVFLSGSEFFPRKSIKFSCQASFSPLIHSNTPAFCLSGPCQTWSIFASAFRKGTLDLSLCGTSLHPAPGGKSLQKHHKRDDGLSECISGGAWWPPFHLGNSKLCSWSS